MREVKPKINYTAISIIFFTLLFSITICCICSNKFLKIYMPQVMLDYLSFIVGCVSLAVSGVSLYIAGSIDKKVNEQKAILLLGNRLKDIKSELSNHMKSINELQIMLSYSEINKHPGLSSEQDIALINSFNSIISLTTWLSANPFINNYIFVGYANSFADRLVEQTNCLNKFIKRNDLTNDKIQKYKEPNQLGEEISYENILSNIIIQIISEMICSAQMTIRNIDDIIDVMK